MIDPQYAEVTEEEAPQAEPPAGRSSSIIIWLIVFSMAVLFLPLYLITTTLQEGIPQLEAELATLEAEIAITATTDPREIEMRGTLSALRADITALSAQNEALWAAHINWPAVIAHIADHDPSQLSITQLTQVERRIALSGHAAQETGVTAYVEHLRGSPYFVDVALQSINLKYRPTPTPPPRGQAQTEQLSEAPPAERIFEFTILLTLGAVEKPAGF